VKVYAVLSYTANIMNLQEFVLTNLGKTKQLSVLEYVKPT